MVGADLKSAGRQKFLWNFRGRAITSKWQVGVLLGAHRGWILRMASLYKGRLLWPSAGNQTGNLLGFLSD